MTYYSPARVLAAALDEYGVSLADLPSSTKAPAKVKVKQHIAFAMRQLSIASMPEIATLTRAPHHSTIDARIKAARANGGPEFVVKVRKRLESSPPPA